MLKRLLLVLDTIKIAHSIFALPFALVAMLVAAGGWPSWKTVGLIVGCMVLARSAAMAFNRYTDREFDATNPRTKTRPSVTGAISPGFLLAFVLITSAGFVACAAFLNPVCGYCAVPVLAFLCGYSYTKRFTALCHFWLGAALGFAPVGAHLAVTGNLQPLAGLGTTWNAPIEFFPWLLGLAVLCWVSGFDLIYACQDFNVDSADERLHSLPKRIGIANTLRLSTALHVAAVLLLIGVGIYAHLQGGYFAAVALVSAILFYEHRIVKPDDLSRVNVAFFTLNGAVSLVLLLAVWIEKTWK